MKPQKRFFRFLFGFTCMLIFMVIGFLWVTSAIPSWGATSDEINQTLPGDSIILQSQLSWNNAITIHATPKQIYPWLIQIGDNRAGFYSFTFIENLFQIAGKQQDRYANADRIHPEWQDPPTGKGIIADWMAIQDYRPSQYVLASATPKFFGMEWTWLWYLQPVDLNTTRLIVRHRFAFPEDMPRNLMMTVLDAGYVMERGMMLGIRNRAQGNIPPTFEEPLGIILWLIALACGLMAAVSFIRHPGHNCPLGIGLVAIVFLFIFTFIQPAIWLRVIVDLGLMVSEVITYQPDSVSILVKAGKMAQTF